MTNYRKLYRSRNDRMIAGVCGGIAKYFRVDPTIIRIIAAILICFGGLSLVVYLILWIIMPLEPTKRHPRVIDVN